MIRSVLKGTGSALPKQLVTNHELAERVDTSHDWIVERTGIHQRYIAGEGETTSTLATEAARKAIDAAGVDPESIELIVLATSTPDQTFPASATDVLPLMFRPCVPAFFMRSALRMRCCGRGKRNALW